MRCLQCGKAIPLLKRLGGSAEFCSEAHRREYQDEFSQLALGRLLQSQPAEFQAQTERAPILAGTPAAALRPPPIAENGVPATNGKAVLNGAPAALKQNIPPGWGELDRPPAAVSDASARPNGVAKSSNNGASQAAGSPPAAAPKSTSQTSAPDPPEAPAAQVDKPVPAGLPFAPKSASAFELALASLAPGWPHYEPEMWTAELPQGPAFTWESSIAIANSIAPPLESKLDPREMPRNPTRIFLDLRVAPPENLAGERRPLTIRATPAAAPEASLWIGSYRDFAGELVSLRDFANIQFAKLDFEAPALALDSAVAAEPLAAEPQAAVVDGEPSSEEPPAPAPDTPVQIPEPELNPLPVNATGTAPARAKPLPVFGPVAIGAGTLQVPQPARLPLRAVTVLARATTPPTEVKQRNPGTAKTELQPSPTPGGLSAEGSENSRSAILVKTETQVSTPSGLPELPMPAPGDAIARMRKMIAAITGAVVLGAGVFFFSGKQSAAGSKPAAPAMTASGGRWLADFAPDPRRQRRVSLLRSSMNLSAYRVDFESSIQIKALGWVYRALDAKNFYVSKIEFKKPGVNPVYVLVHYAVINGVDQPRVETPLPVSVPMGGLYKIHFEAVGNRFTTWVQGQQAEQWTDARLSSGGAGTYGEGSEQSVLHGDFVVTPVSN